MSIFRNSSNKLYCFTPPVMLATMAIEFAGAIYTIWRYKLDQVGRLVVALLVFLGIFQLAEYMICTAPLLPGLTWARIGYVSITILPPLGISLAMAIAGKKSWPLQTLMYVGAGVFIYLFGFAGGTMTGQVCGGNYVIFTAKRDVMLWYGTYYYVLLAVSTFLSLFWANKTKNVHTRTALRALAFGYLAFILPTVTVGLFNESARDAIPSVMCGFAVLLALVLLIFVLPHGAKLRKAAAKKSKKKA